VSASEKNVIDFAKAMSDAAANSEKFLKALKALDPEVGDVNEVIAAMAAQYEDLSASLDNNRDKFVEMYKDVLPKLIEAYEAGLISASKFTEEMLDGIGKSKSAGAAAAGFAAQAIGDLNRKGEELERTIKQNKFSFIELVNEIVNYNEATTTAIQKAAALKKQMTEGGSVFVNSLEALNNWANKLVTLDFYPVRSEFLQTVGVFGEGQAHLDMLGRSTTKFATKFGADTLDVQKALIGLRGEFGLLRGQFDENSTELELILTLQQRFGAEAGASAGYFRILTQGYGMTTKGAKNFYLELINVADASGLVSAQLINDMHENAAMISRFGIKTTFALTKIAMAAKETGLSMGTVFDVADKFTSIQGAIETTAKLNAAFGTSLDAFGMFAEQEPATIFATLQEELAGATGDFNNLNKQQKAFLANALNLDDAQVQLFISSDNLHTAFSQVTSDMENQASMADLSREAMTTMMPLIKNMTNIFMSMQPFIRGVALGLNTFGFILAFVIKQVAGLMGSDVDGFLQGLGVVVGFIAGPVAFLVAKSILLGKAFTGVAAAASSVGAAIGGATTAAMATFSQLMASLKVGGFQLAAVTAAVGVLAVGMGFLTEQVAASPSAFFAAAVGMTAFTYAALAIGASIASPPGATAGMTLVAFLGALAGVALAVGLAFKLAGSGIEHAAAGIGKITAISGPRFADTIESISELKAEMQALARVDLRRVEGSLNRITQRAHQPTSSRNYASGPTGKRTDPVFVNVVNTKDLKPAGRRGLGEGLATRM